MENKKTTLFVILGCILLIGITISFAYYLASIQGEGKNITLKTKTLKITFTESNNLSGENITPGWSKTSTFTVKNEGNESYSYSIVIKDLINTFVTTGFLQYKITSTDGGYNMTDFKDIPKSSVASNKKIATNITIEGNGTHTYTILFTYKNSEDNQAGDMGKILSGQIIIDEYTITTLANQLLEDNPTISTRTDFSTPFTTNTANTLYKATENGTDVYYFAGQDTASTPVNNWVKFGKNSSNQDLYWRIMRTNADGSIRLLYHGTSTTATDAYIGESTFNTINTNVGSPKYVGYMYGNSDTTLEEARTNTNDSTIKAYIDNWYANNMTSYTKYLSTTAVYCNDRELASGASYSATGSSFYYAAYTRLVANKTPTYDCTNDNDKFTVDASTGNRKLTYPIALMTADEIAYAGGVYVTNAPMWYYTNSSLESSTGTTIWWSLSPVVWTGSNAGSWFVVGSDGPGVLSADDVGNSYGARPVISLKGNLVWKSGDGSSASPYEVEEIPPTLAETIKTHATSHTNGVYNENGYRYEGTDPNNYIYMTNKSTNEKELWRIIGVFNDGANGEEVIRVRRHYEKISYPNMAYDSNGTNHFPNTTIYNTLSNKYNLTNYNHTVNYKMYLGTSGSPKSLTSSGWYTAERGNTPGKTASDSYNNSISFIGSVGLIYPSDYGYAVLASDCARTTIASKYNATVACHNNNWLFHGGSNGQWLISPSASDAWGAFYIGSSAGLYSTAGVSNAMGYSPVMSLEAGVIVSGSGTKTDPYVISM